MRWLIVAALWIGSTGIATAQPPIPDRVTYGESVHVAEGETVEEVITMGGHATIDGHVLSDVVTMGGDVVVTGIVVGDIVTMGGNLDVTSSGIIQGDLVTMGGEINIEEGARVRGARIELDTPTSALETAHGHSRSEFGEWIADAFSSLLACGLLFVLGLVLMGAAPERLSALQSMMVRRPFQTGATGVVGLIGAIVLLLLLVVTVLGIPFAILGAVLLPVVLYVGLAAVSTVVGAALPIRALSGRPVLQLAAGVGVFAASSLIPYVGAIVLLLGAAFGLGALLLTRGKRIDALPSVGAEVA